MGVDMSSARWSEHIRVGAGAAPILGDHPLHKKINMKASTKACEEQLNHYHTFLCQLCYPMAKDVSEHNLCEYRKFQKKVGDQMKAYVKLSTEKRREFKRIETKKYKSTRPAEKTREHMAWVREESKQNRLGYHVAFSDLT